MATTEADVAAQLIERLLTDPEFRAEFRRDPAAACRAAGLESLADEMALGAGKAMMTLDVRESKSSLAGVMMAAAMEGVGVYQFGAHVLPHLDDVPAAVGDVLSRVNLPSLGGALAQEPAGGGAPAAGSEGAGAGTADGAAGGPAAAAAAAAPPAAPGEAAAPGGGADAPGAVPPEQAAAQKIAATESPEARRSAAAQDAASAIAEDAEDLPDPSALPDGPVTPQPAEVADSGGASEAAAATAPPEAAAAPPPAAPPAPEVAPVAVEPVESGGGVGVSEDAAARALLKNENVVLDADAQADVAGGAVDPRLIALLDRLSSKHKIELSVIKTGHDQFTSGGSVSNHFLGRGIDIARVDGEIVNPGSAAARELAGEIAGLSGELRPTEVGTPWAIAASGFFTDGGHQDHLHVAYDGELPDGFKPPAPVAGVAGAIAEPAAAGAPAAAPAAAAADPHASQAFKAVTAEAAAAPRKGDTLAFDAPAQPAAGAPPADAAAPAAADLSSVSDAYPGDDAPREQVAAWMAKLAEERGLPPELPIMASLVESGMKNLNFGDADSVGFFQMRVGIWNQGEYAGYPDRPELQMKWFLDHAEAVKEQRVAAGRPIDDPSSFGEWIADVERPAEQYRGRYQLQLNEAQGLLEQVESSTPAQAPAAAAAEPVVVPVEPSGSRRPIDPDQYGGVGQGTGGPPDAEASALLKNDNVVLDSVGVSDIKAGRIDPRVVAVLTKLSQEHEITVSCMCSDHSQFTAGGSVSNHYYGRGLDIAAIDGVPVNASNFDAREIAMELQDFDPAMRPNEIGTPWAIAGPGYFTDSDHQDHLHVGFKQAITPDWKPPAAVAAGAQAPAPVGAVAAAAPGAPAAAAAVQPAGKPGDSLAFKAVTAEAAGAAKPGKGDSLAFMQAAEAPAEPAAGAAAAQPAGPASAVASPAAVPAAVADAAAATAAGGSRLGASALEVAQGELGVREAGDNTGVDVDKYLKAAGVTPGNPWCASFVTWALAQSGHEMEGGGWAAVETWVRNAEQGNNDLQIVSAEEARPGDMVAYDWGGQDDFGADAHIGFLASNVEDGKFTAVEGNFKDAVLRVPRQVGSDGTNMKFIRINGGEPPPSAPGGGVAAGGAPAADAAASAAVAPPASDPAAVADAQAAAERDAAEVRKNDSLQFMAVKAEEARKHRATVQFMKAIDPEMAKGAAPAPEPAAAAAAAPSAPPAEAPAAAGPPPDLSGVEDYPGDDASQAELAKWLAKEAQKEGLPPELPVMASLVESGVKNLNFGDADSVGFFQMRVGIWNQGAYAGYPENPGLQAKWFVDQALAVKRKALADGNVDFGKDPARYGEWIADIERPAEQYRGRYQLRLQEARQLLSG